MTRLPQAGLEPKCDHLGQGEVCYSCQECRTGLLVPGLGWWEVRGMGQVWGSNQTYIRIYQWMSVEKLWYILPYIMEYCELVTHGWVPELEMSTLRIYYAIFLYFVELERMKVGSSVWIQNPKATVQCLKLFNPVSFFLVVNVIDASWDFRCVKNEQNAALNKIKSLGIHFHEFWKHIVRCSSSRYTWAGELAQPLGALIALAEDWGIIPSTHMVAYTPTPNSDSGDPTYFSKLF